jgi:hypothetical protein
MTRQTAMPSQERFKSSPAPGEIEQRVNRERGKSRLWWMLLVLLPIALWAFTGPVPTNSELVRFVTPPMTPGGQRLEFIAPADWNPIPGNRKSGLIWVSSGQGAASLCIGRPYAEVQWPRRIQWLRRAGYQDKIEQMTINLSPNPPKLRRDPTRSALGRLRVKKHGKLGGRHGNTAELAGVTPDGRFSMFIYYHRADKTVFEATEQVVINSFRVIE